MRRLLIAAVLLYLAGMLVAPLATVLIFAFRTGLPTFDTDTLAAIRLTLITALIAVPLNTLFGVAAAWAITKSPKNSSVSSVFQVLVRAFISAPFAVSPVIAGMIFVLLFGARGWFPGHHIIFTPVAIILATMFVTVPFVARELIPVMEELGRDEEEGAILLGANGWQTLRRVTLPNVKWGLLHGVVLCTARAMGEFGAVSVVSGHIRGRTTTLPLDIEMRYNEYDFVGAFSASSLLMLVAVATLVAKHILERRQAT
jgi:sulfate/thiosulfate transport system permease protein